MFYKINIYLVLSYYIFYLTFKITGTNVRMNIFKYHNLIKLKHYFM